MTPDTSILLAAARTDHPLHLTALACLNESLSAAATGTSFTILPMVLVDFLRRATDPTVFREPTPIQAALDFIDSLLAVPGVEIAEVGREWPSLRRIVIDGQLSGDDVFYSWIAACVQSSGEHLVTFDTHFAKRLNRAEFMCLGPATTATPAS